MGLIEVDNYTIVIDKINYWKTFHDYKSFYLCIYLNNGTSVDIKRDDEEEIVKIEKELNRAFGYIWD